MAKPVKPAKLDKQRLRSVRAEVSGLERRLERLQNKLREVEELLGDANLYVKERSDNVQDLVRNRESLVDEIQQAENEWLQHSSALEELQGEG